MTMKKIGIDVEEEVRRDFAMQIAEKIAEDIEVEEIVDVMGFDKVFKGRLRVVKPGFRF